MRLIILATVLCGLGLTARAQSNVRAWQAQGQVWVVWTWDTNAPPASFAIYARTNTTGAFTNIAQGALTGRLLQPEWSGSEVIQQSLKAFGVPPVTGFVVPTNNVGGTYSLAPDEGLFVETVRSDVVPRVYAVLPYGDKAVTAKRRSGVVTPHYSLADAPQMHLQASGLNAVTANVKFPVAYYVLWADGDQDETVGRSDFPIMGNAAKRGAPHLYMVVTPQGGLQGRTNVPATLLFHGADADASLWLPSNEGPHSINTLPVDGPVIAPDEKVWRTINGTNAAQNSRWFGYVRGFDPFDSLVPAGSPTHMLSYSPPATEVIIDYTYRQLLWAMDWFGRTLFIDSNRVSLIGHSAGSVGANHFSRAHPERFSAVELFNCGQRYFESPMMAAMQGEATLNLPTNLTNREGGAIHLLDLFPFSLGLSATQRDFPFARVYAGKCDGNEAMHWGEDMVEVMRDADELGWGHAFFWDLRKHGFNEWQDYWVDASTLASIAKQTKRDDVAGLTRYAANQSFPAFFRFQHYSNHGDPGPGALGGTRASACTLNTTNRDDHGTWGGYYDWQSGDLVDSRTNWACTVFLAGKPSGYAAVDESPLSSMMSDVAIRRPQQFAPAAGSLISWVTRRLANGAVVQTGSNVVAGDGLVVLTNVVVPRDPERLRIEVVTVGGGNPVDPVIALPGFYSTHVVVPHSTDPRISWKNAPQYAYAPTNGGLRNELVVVFPGTGGVPSTFENFSQNAANLGFHAIALTYDNEVAMANYCGMEADTRCYTDVRYEFLTGVDTTSKTNVSRFNSIEFRLASFLNWLNTNAPAEGWGQFLVATNAGWTNALAWDRFRLVGHSQGAGYAGFIAKLHEVQRVVMFAGGDFSPSQDQAAEWGFWPSATPSDRWFGFSHYKDPDEFVNGEQIPNWEAFGIMGYGPVVDVSTNLPPYNYSHGFMSTLEPWPNVFGEIEYHGATVNDTPQVRDTHGIPVYVPVWSHMLDGPVSAPKTGLEIADSVRDFSLVQGSNSWSYGCWFKSADANGQYAANEFHLLPITSNTLYSIPAHLLSNGLPVAIWASGMRPLGVYTNVLVTNNPTGVQIWPVRRWVSTMTGTVQIQGSFAKWDSIASASISGQVLVNGVPLWSASVAGDDISGTRFTVEATVVPGTPVDFLASPGITADASGAYFSAIISLLSAPVAPRFGPGPEIVDGKIRLIITNTPGLQLTLETSTNLVSWTTLGQLRSSSNPVVYVAPIKAPVPARYFRARQP